MNEKLTIDEKFSKAQSLMSILYPSLVSFYCLCEKNEIDDVTLRLKTKTGMKCTIEYGSKFIDAISVKSLCVLICTEMFRLMLHHPTTRLQYPVNLTLEASNYICIDNKTLEINLPSEIKNIFPNKKHLKELDNNFDVENDLYLEKVFSLLLNNQVENESNSENTNDNEESNGEKENETENEKEYESEEDALKKHYSVKNNIKNTEEWGENEIIDAQVAENVNRQSVAEWSNLPSSIREKIMFANQKKFDPRTVIKNFVRSVFSPFYNFSRMRNYRRDERLTGIIPGKIHGQMANVLFAIDTSGSMKLDEIERGISVFKSALKHAKCSYCFWDTSCSPFFELDERTKNYTEYDISCGGTDPQCVIDKIKEENKKYDGIVFITDCYFKWVEPEIKSTVFILQTDDSGSVPEWCRRHLKMSDIEKL